MASPRILPPGRNLRDPSPDTLSAQARIGGKVDAISTLRRYQPIFSAIRLDPSIFAAYCPAMNDTSPTPPAVKSPIKSPCIRVCTIDGLTSYCLGCYRSLPEIAKWEKFTDAEKDAIMAEKDAREAHAKQRRADWAAKNLSKS